MTKTATCKHCNCAIEDDDGTWYHVVSMEMRCDGPDDEPGISWGELIRQAEPRTCGNILNDGDNDECEHDDGLFDDNCPCDKCQDDDLCDACDGKGYLLDQGYNEADVPEGAIPVQACDECLKFPEIEAGALLPYGPADERATRAAFESEQALVWGYSRGSAPEEGYPDGGHGEYWIILDRPPK